MARELPWKARMIFWIQKRLFKLYPQEMTLDDFAYLILAGQRYTLALQTALEEAKSQGAATWQGIKMFLPPDIVEFAEREYERKFGS